MNGNRAPIINNVFWLVIDKVVRVIGGLVIGIWLARYLGPNDFGILNYALAYIGFFTVFVNLGLEQLAIKELVKYPLKTELILGTIFSIKLIGAMCAICLVLFSLIFTDLDLIVQIAIIMLSISFLAQSLDVIDYFFQAQVMSKKVVLARDSAFLLSSMVKVILIVQGFDVLSFVLVSTIEIFLSAIFLCFVYQRNVGNISKWQFSLKYAAEWLVQSWPIAISILLISIHTRIDQIMIGSMLTHSDVGIYSVALKISEFYYFIPAIILSTFQPYLTELASKNLPLYNQRLFVLYSLMFWLGVLQAAIIFFFGEQIIDTLFGDDYKNSYQALVFTACTGIFVGQATIRWIWMLNENLQKFRLYNNFLAVIVNIVLNIVLIPRVGIVGAAIATLMTQVISTWGTSLFWPEIRGSTMTMFKSINPKNLCVYTYQLCLKRKTGVT